MNRRLSVRRFGHYAAESDRLCDSRFVRAVSAGAGIINVGSYWKASSAGVLIDETVCPTRFSFPDPKQSGATSNETVRAAIAKVTRRSAPPNSQPVLPPHVEQNIAFTRSSLPQARQWLETTGLGACPVMPMPPTTGFAVRLFTIVARRRELHRQPHPAWCWYAAYVDCKCRNAGAGTSRGNRRSPAVAHSGERVCTIGGICGRRAGGQHSSIAQLA